MRGSYYFGRREFDLVLALIFLMRWSSRAEGSSPVPPIRTLVYSDS